jgi:hypothetical protein
MAGILRKLLPLVALLAVSCLDPGAGDDENNISSVNVSYCIYQEGSYQACVRDIKYLPNTQEGRELAGIWLRDLQNKDCNETEIAWNQMTGTCYDRTVQSNGSVTENGTETVDNSPPSGYSPAETDIQIIFNNDKSPLYYGGTDYLISVTNIKQAKPYSRWCQIKSGDKVIKAAPKTSGETDTYILSCNLFFDNAEAAAKCGEISVPLIRTPSGSGFETAVSVECGFPGGTEDKIFGIPGYILWNDGPKEEDIQLSPASGQISATNISLSSKILTASVINITNGEAAAERCELKSEGMSARMTKKYGTPPDKDAFEISCLDQHTGSMLCNGVGLPLPIIDDDYSATHNRTEVITSCTLKNGVAVEAAGIISWAK